MCKNEFHIFFLSSEKRAHQKWTREEVAEMNKYFKEFLDTNGNPTMTKVKEIQTESQNAGGVLHLRRAEVIKKKFHNMKRPKKGDILNKP